MKKQPRTTLLQVAGLTAALAFSACEAIDGGGDRGPAGAPTAPSSDASDAPTLSLEVVAQAADSVTVDLIYNRAELDAPRIMELYIETSANITFKTSYAGPAAESADKQVVVQPQDDGSLRTIVYSGQSLHPIDSGAVVRYEFARSGTGEASLNFLERMPIFAPAGANNGLSLGDPVTLAGGDSP